LKKARKEIELYIGRGTGFVASEILYPRKRVLEMAVHEGKDLGQNFVVRIFYYTLLSQMVLQCEH
jgi:hypothetical protein